MDLTLKRRGKEEEEWPDNNGTESVFPLFPHSSGGQSKKGNLNYVRTSGWCPKAKELPKEVEVEFYT